MPPDWGKVGGEKDVSAIRTKRALEAARHREKVPDLTYDLDGDGQVSQRDYFLAKHFDKDKDGRLNTQEREAARTALKDGFESKFLFGLEASANRASHNASAPGYEYERRHFYPVSNHVNHVRVM